MNKSIINLLLILIFLFSIIMLIVAITITDLQKENKELKKLYEDLPIYNKDGIVEGQLVCVSDKYDTVAVDYTVHYTGDRK